MVKNCGPSEWPRKEGKEEGRGEKNWVFMKLKESMVVNGEQSTVNIWFPVVFHQWKENYPRELRSVEMSRFFLVRFLVHFGMVEPFYAPSQLYLS